MPAMNLPTPNGSHRLFLPHSLTGRAGHPLHPHRPLVNCILCISTRCTVRDVPAQYGPCKRSMIASTGAQERYLARILTTLLDQLNDAVRISRELWCIDASSFEPVVRLRARKQPVQPCALAATMRRNSKSQKTMCWYVRGRLWHQGAPDL